MGKKGTKKTPSKSPVAASVTNGDSRFAMKGTVWKSAPEIDEMDDGVLSDEAVEMGATRNDRASKSKAVGVREPSDDDEDGVYDEEEDEDDEDNNEEDFDDAASFNSNEYDDNDDDEDHDDDNDDDDDDEHEHDHDHDDDDGDNNDEEDSDGYGDEDDTAAIPSLGKKKANLRKRAEEYASAEKRKGIIYLSRMPPFMKPAKLRHMMGQFGDIGRVYCQAEDPQSHKRRVKYGGNKKKKFTEAWVEFSRKKIAKRVALSLNGTRIGAKKGDYYHDDLWCMKYLPKFKWNNLTERVAYENAMRDKRLQTELSRSRKEATDYLERVDRAKMVRSISERHEKNEREGNANATQKPKKRNADAMETQTKQPQQQEHQERNVRQRKSVASAAERPALPDSLLSRVFAKKK